jgi:RNA polymerase sigma-70 factor (ECF subfamily)
VLGMPEVARPVLPQRDATAARGPGEDEAVLVAALRRRDEAAFMALVRRHHASMVRLARTFVPSREVAEEVAQETWLAVIQQLDRFEGRSSLRTWIFHILVNQAKTRGARERRSVPFSAFAGRDDADEPLVEADRFLDDDHRWAGHWSAPPESWSELPESHLLTAELGARLRAAIDDLPQAQRAVVLLRDVDCLSGPEVCDLLGVSEGNQRVLLHRGRSKVRAALEDYIGKVQVTT